MSRKKTPNELYWEHMENQELEREYNAFLAEQGQTRGPDSAWAFAMRKGHGGYRKKSEREIILALVGRLPEMYD